MTIIDDLNSHNVGKGTVPVRPVLDEVAEPLHVLDEHATAWCLATEHQETGDDLPQSCQDRGHVAGDYSHAIPHAEENRNWNRSNSITNNKGSNWKAADKIAII